MIFMKMVALILLAIYLAAIAVVFIGLAHAVISHRLKILKEKSSQKNKKNSNKY